MTRPAPSLEQVDELERQRSVLHDRARAAVGVTGSGAAPDSLGSILRAHRLGVYPLVALCGLVIVDQFQLAAFGVLAPEVSTSLGLSPAVYSAIFSLRMLALSAMAMPIAALVQRHPRRALVAVTTGLGWALMTLCTAFSGGFLALAGVFVADGASSGSVQTTHPSLLFDTYPTSVRSRLLAIYQSCTYLALVLAPALVALLVFLDLTWRGVFLVLGGICVAVALAAARLRDPGFGGFDAEQVRSVVGDTPAGAQPPGGHVDTSLRFFEAARRVLAVPTVRRLLVSNIFFGMFLAPLVAFLSFYLQSAFHLGPAARGIYNAILPAPAVVAVVLFGRHGERWYAEDPARLLRSCARILGISVILMSLSIAIPALIPYTVVTVVAYGGIVVAPTALSLVTLSVLPPQVRAHASALSGIATFGAGALVGTIFLDGIDSRYGIGASIVALVIPGVVAAAVISSAQRTVNADLDALVDEIVEDQELSQLLHGGATLPMLACRHLDFAYDSLQVLFDVSFAVDEGEMVALLGTNGAGKSTLLRVVSGLGLPRSGTVRYQGADVTYLDPQRRVDLGIMQISGGKGTFPRLTVLENLRAFGYRLGRDRRALEAGIDNVFEAFPRLAERREQKAGTMSGGENQMLALGCAFITTPKLLLIDELSLGLAPKIVGELLDMVRRINAAGSAVVLVEQSVNIALSLVDHAYFMEKGEMRFDGPAADLLGRGDLLRSVFLEGATKGLAR